MSDLGKALRSSIGRPPRSKAVYTIKIKVKEEHGIKCVILELVEEPNQEVRFRWGGAIDPDLDEASQKLSHILVAVDQLKEDLRRFNIKMNSVEARCGHIPLPAISNIIKMDGSKNERIFDTDREDMELEQVDNIHITCSPTDAYRWGP